MARPHKLPRLEHVKYVHARGKVYAYFNTGKKTKVGKPVYTRMPNPAEIGFYDSYAALKAARTKRTSTVYTVADLVAEFEVALEKRADLAENSKTIYRKTASRVVEFLGKVPANDLQPSDVQLILDNEMPGAGSYNMFSAVVGLIYKWGRQRGKTDLNPTKDIEKVKGGEHEPWPEPVLQAGLAAKDDVVRLAIHLLYYTGQRISDVVRMRWGDIHDGEIFVTQKKTGKEVSPPLTRALSAELERTPKRGITILVKSNGKPYTEAGIRAALKSFTRDLGKECIPHGLRKNAVIALLEAGCTVAEVSAITGQTFGIVEQYASKVNRRRLGKAAILKFDRSENEPRSGKRIGKQPA